MHRLLIVFVVLLLSACISAPEKPKAPPRSSAGKAPDRFDAMVMLARETKPDRALIRERHRYDRAIRATGIDGLRYFYYEPDRRRSIVGFSFKNTGSPKINPRGMRKSGPHREYQFLFADRATENIHLAINDDVKLSGRFSHDNMFRELHFFPRRQLPALTVDHARRQLKITLPTGEPVYFDQDTKELTAGVLVESPIDFNRSRHQRRNPDIRYRGDYLAVTVAQRGEAARRDRVWGQKKFAEAHFPARYPRACRLSPGQIWDQRPEPGDSDPKLTMLHRSDDAVFDVIERACGWDLSSLRGPSRHVAEAGK